MVYTTKGCTVETEREVSGVPVGTILEVPYGKVHGGCLPCNGGTYDKNLYPDLFQYLGTDVLPLILHETPLGGAKWFPKRSNIHPDFVPADGQLLNRSDYPQVTPIFTSDMVHQATDQQFSSDPLNRGHWMTDLQDTFRVPDMNGKSIDSAGAVFVRGDGAKSNEGAVLQGDAIRNITGSFAQATQGGSWLQNNSVSGVFKSSGTTAGSGKRPADGATSPSDVGYGVSLDVSMRVPTADENRPLNLAGCWAVRVKETTQFVIKAAGFIENDGLADIAALSKENAELLSKIKEIENKPLLFAERKSTWALSVNEAAYVPFDVVRIAEDIKPSGNFFQVNKDGVYKITYSLTKDGDIHQMLQIDLLVHPSDSMTVLDRFKVGLNYNGTVSGTAVASVWLTTSGTVYVRLAKGQRVGLLLSATNNLTGRLYSLGNNISIEYIKP